MEASAPASDFKSLQIKARKLEAELERQVALFARLCNQAEQNGLAEAGEDQVSQLRSREEDISSRLERLGDVNRSMVAALGPAPGQHSHVMQRHMDIYNEYTNEFRRLAASSRAVQERAQLLGSAGPPGSESTGGATQLLHRERAQINSSMQAVEVVIRQAAAVGSALDEQRGLLGNTSTKASTLVNKFPVIGGLLNAIRRKKQRDTIIMGLVIGVCVVVALVVLLYR